MNVFIVYAHPSKKSFTYKVLQKLNEGLIAAHHPIKISDLYEMEFRAEMSEEEYEREGLANYQLPISPDVLLEHQKIEWADCIIFLYPLWWSDCPAILKGWFDRVYSLGYAYGHKKSNSQLKKMKSIPYGKVICTAGHPNDFLHEIGISESIRNILLDDRLGQRFQKKELIILGGTMNMEEVEKIHLERVFNIGKEIL